MDQEKDEEKQSLIDILESLDLNSSEVNLMQLLLIN